jgi:hypothetical protein
MATYTIIGGDGKEYGPITADDVRKWLAEGRLNQQSLVKAESDPEFLPLEKFPEFTDAFSARPPGIIAPPAMTSVNDDYELDIGGCISNGFELFKKNFGILFVSILILLAIQIAVSSILNATLVTGLAKIFNSPTDSVLLGLLVMVINSLYFGPLLGGVYLVYLKVIRGETPGVGEIFSGFQKAYAQLVLGTLIVNLLNALCLAPFTFVLAEKLNPVTQKILQLQAQHAPPQEIQNLLPQMFSAFTNALPVGLICLIPVIYLTVCLQFTVVLIIDKQLGFGAALAASWNKVNQHWLQVFGLTFLAILIILLGLFGCLIGILFTLPLGVAVMIYGYETIFSGRKD